MLITRYNWKRHCCVHYDFTSTAGLASAKVTPKVNTALAYVAVAMHRLVMHTYRLIGGNHFQGDGPMLTDEAVLRTLKAVPPLVIQKPSRI